MIDIDRRLLRGAGRRRGREGGIENYRNRSTLIGVGVVREEGEGGSIENYRNRSKRIEEGVEYIDNRKSKNIEIDS